MRWKFKYDLFQYVLGVMILGAIRYIPRIILFSVQEI